MSVSEVKTTKPDGCEKVVATITTPKKHRLIDHKARRAADNAQAEAKHAANKEKAKLESVPVMQLNPKSALADVRSDILSDETIAKIQDAVARIQKLEARMNELTPVAVKAAYRQMIAEGGTPQLDITGSVNRARDIHRELRKQVNDIQAEAWPLVRGGLRAMASYISSEIEIQESMELDRMIEWGVYPEHRLPSPLLRGLEYQRKILLDAAAPDVPSGTIFSLLDWLY